VVEVYDNRYGGSIGQGEAGKADRAQAAVVRDRVLLI
jgi:hypothetical protein